MTTTAPPPSETAIAYHEAGHAVAALLLGDRFDRVSIIPHRDEQGAVSVYGHARAISPYTKVRWRRGVVLYAGLIAELRQGGDSSLDGPTLSAFGARRTLGVGGPSVRGRNPDEEACIARLRVRHAGSGRRPPSNSAAEDLTRSEASEAVAT